MSSITSGKTGRPLSATYRLWRHGHRIGGKTVWRLTTPEFRREYVRKGIRGVRRAHHAKHPLGYRWVYFGNDFVSVRQENGEFKKYHRRWWLPFLVDVWVAQNFWSTSVIRWLRQNLGLQAGYHFGNAIFKWALLSNWEEVRSYLEKKHKIENLFERFDTNIKFSEGIREDREQELKHRLEAAGLVERGLGRIITVEAETEKKQQADDEAGATQKLFMSKLDAIIESDKEADSP